MVKMKIWEGKIKPTHYLHFYEDGDKVSCEVLDAHGHHVVYLFTIGENGICLMNSADNPLVATSGGRVKIT